MKASRSLRAGIVGASLIEVLIALGVLAVALPLVLAALAGAARSAASAQAETRCAWIIPACLDELEAAHAGGARFLPALPRGQPLPAPGEFLALAFADDARPLGCVPRDAYLGGLNRLAGEPARYLASFHTAAGPVRPNTPPLLDLRVTLEYPASVPFAKRHRLDFHTRMR